MDQGSSMRSAADRPTVKEAMMIPAFLHGCRRDRGGGTAARLWGHLDNLDAGCWIWMDAV